MKKRIISMILLVLWMGFIFYNSSQSGDESNNKSYAITNEIKNSVKNEGNTSKDNKVDNNSKDKVTSEVKNNNASDNSNKDNNKQKSEKVISEKMRKVNLFIRKSAHAFEYFVLAILVLVSLSTFGTRTRENVILVLFVVLFYAVGDEYHQLFVNGRTSSVTDVIIDFVGGTIGVSLFYIVKSMYVKISKLRARRSLKSFNIGS